MGTEKQERRWHCKLLAASFVLKRERESHEMR